MAWLYLNKETGETLGRWRGISTLTSYSVKVDLLFRVEMRWRQEETRAGDMETPLGMQCNPCTSAPECGHTKGIASGDS